ncbi:HIT family protein [bacterium]|nr:HIT family protein [bacterium]
MDCLFCKIAKKELEAKIVYEDEVGMAFLDINPCQKGHLLVIPKEHYENLNEVPKEKLAGLFEIVKKMTKLLEEKLGASSFNIGWNHGKDAGQVIPHLHIHIIPRYPNDGGGSMQTIVSVGDENLEETYQKLIS